MTHLSPRSATVLLYQGDDMDQLAHLHRQIVVAERQAERASEKTGTERAGDDDQSPSEARAAVEAAQAAYDEFVDAAAERAVEVVMHSIGSRRFRDLLAEHAPRMVDGELDPEHPDVTPKQVMHPDDRFFDVNTLTFPLALLTFRDGDAATIAQPEFSTVAAVKAFVEDELSDGDLDQLWQAAHLLNRSPTSDPKFLRSMSGSLSTDEM